MINLSKRILLGEENDVLSHGLNFAIVTNYIPKQQTNRKQSLLLVNFLNFVIIQTNEVNRFFDHLNNMNPNINFTIELEQDDKLAFLDVLVMSTHDGKLAIKVH